MTPAPKAEAPKPAPVKPAEPPKAVEAPKPVAPPPAPQPVGPDLVALKADMVKVGDRVLGEDTKIIDKVSVEKSQDRFVVQLSDRWYKLTADEQDDLAKAMLSKAEKIDEGRLEVRDANNQRVARSPYIGDEMIILKRSQLKESEPVKGTNDLKSAPAASPENTN